MYTIPVVVYIQVYPNGRRLIPVITFISVRSNGKGRAPVPRERKTHIHQQMRSLRTTTRTIPSKKTLNKKSIFDLDYCLDDLTHNYDIDPDAELNDKHGVDDVYFIERTKEEEEKEKKRLDEELAKYFTPRSHWEVERLDRELEEYFKEDPRRK